jgi:hypothetical protein
MEFIELGKWLNVWFGKLPKDLQFWLTQYCWWIIGSLVLIVIYKVARQESLPQSGKVEVKWYSPVQWLARFQQIKAENREELPESTRKFLDKVYRVIELRHVVADYIYALIACFFGLLGIIVSIILNPIKAWWMFLPSALLFYIGYKMLRAARAK